jgi:hypothetical protein
MGDAMGDVIRARAAAAAAVSRASELCDSLDSVVEGLRSAAREDSVVCRGLLFIHWLSCFGVCVRVLVWENAALLVHTSAHLYCFGHLTTRNDVSLG